MWMSCEAKVAFSFLRCRKGMSGLDFHLSPGILCFSTMTHVTSSTAAQINPVFPPDVGSAVAFDYMCEIGGELGLFFVSKSVWTI